METGGRCLEDVLWAVLIILPLTPSRRYSGITACGHAADFLGFDNISGDDFEELRLSTSAV